MPNVRKMLGQAAPAATTLTSLYTVPTATDTTVAVITVVNRDAAAGTYRIGIRVAGAAEEVKQWIVYDDPIDAKETVVLRLGLMLAATDIIAVYASNANMSFSASGQENS